MSERKHVGVSEVRRKFSDLREAYAEVLPKVDKAFLNDLLERERRPDRLAYAL